MKTHRIKVLIVDCDEDVLITFERLLEDEGYDTTTAWTGQDALKALQGQVFDLVLVNEYLSDLDTELFISGLRHRSGNVPCIVMQSSATARKSDIGRFLAAGAVAVVCKSSQTKLLEAVSAQVSPTSPMRMQRAA